MVSGILVTVFGGLFIAFMVSRTSFVSSDAQLTVQQAARGALDVMTKELRECGHIDTELTAAGADTPAGGATRLNFQIARGYNVAGCIADAICWGNDTTNGGWAHYLRNGTQLVRCQSNASDTAITDFSACRVLGHDVSTFLVDYVALTKTVMLRLAIQRTSQQLPGGSASTTPAPLRTQIRLRNP